MIFINAQVQWTFFQILSTRRRKRVMYGATPPTLRTLEFTFDKCLTMISCHHPLMWSYGTGNLLVAPKTPEIPTPAAERAMEWRIESLNKLRDGDVYVRHVACLSGSFGSLIRYTMECKIRIHAIRNMHVACNWPRR